MGNSLLDVTVFGRRAGKFAAEYLKGLTEELGEPTFDHVTAYAAELKKLGVPEDRIAPILLPDYTTPEVRERQLTAHYHGTMR
jgi:succinate dehydrogenase/fumarate reductase flavoprotein subunit